MPSPQPNHADLEWIRTGDHVCHFFHTPEDLSEVLIPYFKAGLERGESCLWIAANPYGVQRAESDMRMALADFDRRAAAGQISIVDQGEWDAKHGLLSVPETVQSWLSWKDEALASGYTGIRSGGDLSSLHEGNLDAFLSYERAADNAFKNQPIVALCCYCLSKCSGGCVLDVMRCHGFGLAKDGDDWKPIELWPHERVSRRGARAPSRSAKDQDASLNEVVKQLLAAYMLAYPGRITLEGSQVQIPASPAARLRLALGELIANAEKFGALADPQGALTVRWRLSVNGSRRLSVMWAESGKSGLTIPETIGLGTQVLAGAVENCVRSFEPTGMRCTFELSL
jgi:DcmR-like sensory protein